MTTTQPLGFLAVPPTGKGPGVLVLHAWWGLNDTIKAFCTRLAGSGFVAFAPDLYQGDVFWVPLGELSGIAKFVEQPVIEATGVIVNPNPSFIATVVIPFILPLFVVLMLLLQTPAPKTMST
jgi:hypothetical protein